MGVLMVDDVLEHRFNHGATPTNFCLTAAPTISGDGGCGRGCEAPLVPFDGLDFLIDSIRAGIAAVADLTQSTWARDELAAHSEQAGQGVKGEFMNSTHQSTHGAKADAR